MLCRIAPAIAILMLGVAMLSPEQAVGDSLSPYQVSDKAQLFVDRLLVGSSEGVSFTLHPAEKHPANPLIVCDQPWEGWRIAFCGDVIYDEQDKLFKIWYLADFSDGAKNVAETYVTCYATSKDGIHWEKPKLDVMPTSDGKPTNVVCAFGVGGIRKDMDDPDPSRRYKMVFYHTDLHGYYTATSPDGIHWTRASDKPICPGRDVISCVYDSSRKLYVAILKIMTQHRGHERRVFYLSTSADFATWTTPKLVLATDADDDASSLRRIEEVRSLLDVPDDPKLMRTEFYGVSFYPHECCMIAFPWMLTINNNARFGNQEGPGELQITASRDLEKWDRQFRTPSVRRGRIGEWDCGWFWGANKAIRVGDEIWLYYGAGNYTHGTPCLYRASDPKTGVSYGRGTEYTSSIGLAKWKLDRFVSVDGPSDAGKLTTIPIAYDGDRLEINALTRDGGSIVVELLSMKGSVLAHSKPFVGDSLRHTLSWDRSFNPGKYAGKPVMLRFVLKNAELYSFAFRGPRP